MTSLRQFQKSKRNKSATEAIKKNDIAIIYDEKVPSHLWRLGRVVHIIASKDCNILVAKIKVGKTVAIQSIYSILFYYYFVSFRLTTVVMITQILYKMVSKLFIRL